jgi:hypothetical protein
MQSINTQSENKPHHLETEATPPVLEKAHPTLLLDVIPTLNVSPDNAQTLTPPCLDFPTPTLPCSKLNLSPTLENATVKTTPAVEIINTTTPEITTINPDEIIHSIHPTVSISDSRKIQFPT